MTSESEKLLAAAIDMVGLRGSFDPAEVGEKVGLSKMQSAAAVRTLSNDGVVELGFDMCFPILAECLLVGRVAGAGKKALLGDAPILFKQTRDLPH